MKKTRRFKEKMDEMAKALADNLSRNALLDHIDEVGEGIMKPDELYYRYVKHRSKLASFEGYRRLKREYMYIKKPFLLLILLAALLFSGAFYWYEYRPSAIIRECHAYADNRSKTGDRNDARIYNLDINSVFRQTV